MFWLKTKQVLGEATVVISLSHMVQCYGKQLEKELKRKIKNANFNIIQQKRRLGMLTT